MANEASTARITATSDEQKRVRLEVFKYVGRQMINGLARQVIDGLIIPNMGGTHSPSLIRENKNNTPPPRSEIKRVIVPTVLGDIPTDLSTPSLSPFDNMIQEEIDGFWDWIS